MKRFELWKLSVQNVFASPLRSSLTVLGMAIGIGAILAVLTLGEAGQTQVRSEMTRLGIDKVWMTAAEDGALRHGDAQLVADALSLAATEQIYLSATIAADVEAQEAAVLGCTKAYFELTDAHTVQGRMFYPLEWQEDGRSVLIGTALAERLRIAPGDIVLLSQRPFTVCGVIETGSGFSRVDAAETAFLPLEVLCEMTEQTVHEIMIDVPQDMMPQTVAAMAADVMESQREQQVETLTMQVQIEAANSVINTFVEVLKWVAFICILVGGIGVMNILLVSVRERRREIGVMKSLGTTREQICLLFLLEALIYAMIGGVLGILLGMGLIDSAGRSIGLTPTVYAVDCIAVFLVALAIGLIFGVAPAFRASGLKPVDALRTE